MRECLSRVTIKVHEASSEKEARDRSSHRLVNGSARYRMANRGTVHSVILVTGATGNLGRHVVSQLRTGDANCAVTRNNPGTADLAGDIVRGDPLYVSDTLGACLDEIEAIFLVCTFFAAEATSAVLDMVTTRMRRIVYLLGQSVGDDLGQQTDTITTKPTT